MLLKLISFILVFNSFLISATEFTISSYNCGGLSHHYDYLRAATMEKLMQERTVAEPEYMSINEKIQKVALKILFTSDPYEKMLTQQEWDRRGYQGFFEHLTSTPSNAIWNTKADDMITTYLVRPVVIFDEKVNGMLDAHLGDLASTIDGSREDKLQEVRKLMATRIIANHLNYDIICLQEADYLEASVFPENYTFLFAETTHSRNGIAWNEERFELIESLGNILGRAFAIQLLDKETNQTILVASGHLSGCNPYRVEMISSISDSAKGDCELRAILELFNRKEADFKIIGMDSNVTSLHPRMQLLKDADYRIDYENYLEPTCTNPYQVLNTRIDWIALKSNSTSTITNIPVLSVGLNNIQTNISDHKPIAAKISY